MRGFTKVARHVLSGQVQSQDKGPRAPVKAAQRLSRSSGILAASVLLDSAVEHYRGSFHNPAMIAPIATSLVALLASTHGIRDERQRKHATRNRIFWLTAATGLVGTGFHLYNVAKKRGGLSWQNLFYSGPLGAPAAIGLSGLFGLLAERVRDTAHGEDPTLWGRGAGRALGWVTASSLLGTAGEAGLLRFRGAFHDPAMYLPVTMPPIAAALWRMRRQVHRTNGDGSPGSGSVSPRSWVRQGRAFTSMASPAPWVDRATGGKIWSTDPRSRRLRALSGWRSRDWRHSR